MNTKPILTLTGILLVHVCLTAQNIQYSPEQQAAIDAKRAEAMAADKARLHAELKRVPAQRQEVLDNLKPYVARHGVTGDEYLLCRPNIFVPRFERNNPLREDALQNLVAFSKQLKARGIDLIVATVPTQMEVYAHRFHPEVGPEACIDPERAKAMITLLEAGVEVIDMTSAFQQYDAKAQKDGLPLLYHAADHHWKSPGTMILAEAVAKRLERYPHLNERRGSFGEFTLEDREVKAPTSLYSFNGIEKAKASNPDVLNGANLPAKETLQQVIYPADAQKVGGVRVQFNKEHREYGLLKKLKMDPNIMVIGDSQVFFNSGPKGGAGFPNVLSYKMQQPVMWFGRVGFNGRWGQYWAKDLAPMSVQPKVVVFNFMTSGLQDDSERTNWRPVPEFAKVGEFTRENPKYAQIKKRPEHEVILGELPPAPQPKSDPYKDAFFLNEVILQSRGMKGGKVAVISWAMKDRVIDPGTANWKKGDTVKLKLTRWDEMVAKNPEWPRIQQLDAGVDFELPLFFAEVVE